MKDFSCTLILMQKRCFLLTSAKKYFSPSPALYLTQKIRCFTHLNERTNVIFFYQQSFFSILFLILLISTYTCNLTFLRKKKLFCVIFEKLCKQLL